MLETEKYFQYLHLQKLGRGNCFAVLAMTGLPYKLKAPEILAVPLTSNVASGEVVPIPTLFPYACKISGFATELPLSYAKEI